MTANLSILVSADTKQAKGAFQELERNFKVTAGSINKVGLSATKLKSDFGTMAAETNLAALKVNDLNLELLRSRTGANAFAGANRAAAGSVGNLAAQFNDIGVMLAAGQNPLQLAIQQGTQITQVIGPMGAAGAFQTLKAALKSMVSPVSLVTLGVIAGGAALFQWATSAATAKDEANAYEDALKAVEDRLDSTTEKLAVMQSGFGSREELFLNSEIKRLSEQRQDLLDAANTASLYEGNALYAKADAIEDELALLREQLALLKETEAGIEREGRIRKSIVETSRAGIEFRIAAEARMAAKVGQNLKLYYETRAESDALVASKTSLLNQLHAEAEMQRQIAQHGQQSLEVATARVQAERNAFIETELSADMSDTLRSKLLAAWDAANGVASSDMAGNIELAVTAAERLAITLSKGRAIVAAAKNNPDFYDERNESGLAGETDPNKYDIPWTLPGVTLPPMPGKSKRTRRGGGRSTARQETAAQSLIDRLQEELDLLRETDPVQQAMIRNREALAVASDAERGKIEELITQKVRETEVMERNQQIWDDIRQAGQTALDALISKSADFEDILATLAVDLLEVIILGNRVGNASGGIGGGFWNVLLGGSGGASGSSVTASQNQLISARAQAPIRASQESQTRVSQANDRESSATVIHQHFGAVHGEEAMRKVAREGAMEALGSYDKEVLPSRVAQIRANPRRRG